MATEKTSNLQAKRKKADPVIRKYIAELELENEKLQRQIAKLEVQKVSSENRLKALEEEIKENKPQINFSVVDYANTKTKAPEKSPK